MACMPYPRNKLAAPGARSSGTQPSTTRPLWRCWRSWNSWPVCTRRPCSKRLPGMSILGICTIACGPAPMVCLLPIVPTHLIVASIGEWKELSGCSYFLLRIASIGEWKELSGCSYFFLKNRDRKIWPDGFSDMWTLFAGMHALMFHQFWTL